MLLVLVFQSVVLGCGLGWALRLVHAKGTLAWSHGVLLEISIRELAVLLASAAVVRRVHGLNLNHDGAKVALCGEDVVVRRYEMWLEFLGVDDEDFAWELLVES